MFWQGYVEEKILVPEGSEIRLGLLATNILRNEVGSRQREKYLGNID